MTNTEETAWLESVRVEFEGRPLYRENPWRLHRFSLDENRYDYADVQNEWEYHLAAKRKDRETIERLKEEISMNRTIHMNDLQNASNSYQLLEQKIEKRDKLLEQAKPWIAWFKYDEIMQKWVKDVEELRDDK